MVTKYRMNTIFEHKFLLLVASGLFLVCISYLTASNTFLAIIMITIPLLYFIFHNRLWILYLVALPSFALGEIFTIQVSRDLSYTMYIGEALIVILVIFYLIKVIVSHILLQIKWDRFTTILGIYLVVSCMSYVHVLSSQWFLVNFKVALLMFLAYFLGRQLIVGSRRIRSFFYMILVYAIILSLQTFFLSFSDGLTAEVFVSRHLVSLPIGAIAFVSALLVFMIPLLLSFGLKQTDIRKKSLFLIVTLMTSISAFLLLSKGALMCLAIGIIFFAVRDHKHGKKIILGSIGSIAIVALLLSPFFFGLVDRFIGAFTDINNQYRIEEYKIAWSIIKDNLLFGIGPGQQIVYFQKLFYPDFMNLLNNYYMQSFIDLGVIGLSLFLWLTWEIVRSARRALLSYDHLLAIGIVSSLIIAFLNGLIEVTFFGLAYAVLFWATVAVMNNLETYEDIDSHHQL